jgi:hypothetical protein
MKMTAIALSGAMLLSPVAAMADQAAPAAVPAQQQAAALAPGSAAGVHQAQSWQNSTWTYVLIGAAVIGGVVWAASSGGGHHHQSTPTTNNP